MAQTDFELLKNFCDKNGFDVFFPNQDLKEPYFVIRKINGFLDDSEIDAIRHQKIKEAFNIYGGVKTGDMFDRTIFGMEVNTIQLRDYPDWVYNKELDEFGIDDFVLYKNGFWAGKIKI